MWRIIVIDKESNIKLKNECLFINNKTIFLDDISVIIFNSKYITLNSYTLFKLSEYNICTIITDDKFMPISIMHNINGNCRISNVLESQIELSKVVRNNLWKKIIERKIYNQSLCLEILGMKYELIRNISSTVKCNDSNNRESYAAREYFKILFEGKHTRKSANLTNSALNYCYAIVRSNIARYCVGHGLNTQLGIFHKSDLNAFNLVDDLIEVFRPIIDLFVIETLKEHVEYEEITTIIKNKLVYINLINIKYDKRKYSMDKCIDLYVANFKRCIIENSYKNFKTPELISLEMHKYE